LVDELKLFLLIAVSGALAGLILLLIWGLLSRAGIWILDRIDPSRAFMDDEGAAAVTTRWLIALLMFALMAYLIFGFSTVLIDGIADWIFS
jgi:hypothetical protein